MHSLKKIACQIVLVYTLIFLFLSGIIPFVLFAGDRIHIVKTDETLYSLSLQYDISIQSLKEANNLNRDLIRTGEELTIPLDNKDKYIVRPGDTLSGIAVRTGIELTRLASLNRLDPSALIAGMELELVRPPEEGETITVEAGDTLSWISLKYDISVSRLKQINNLKNNELRIGQILELTDPRPQIITVEEGDSLWNISSRYNITMETLKKWNNLESEILYRGQEIQLYETVLKDLAEPDEFSVKTEGIIKEKPVIPPPVKLAALSFEPPLYYSRPTDSRYQPSRGYSEEDLESPWKNYEKASQLLNDFNQAIDSLQPLGTDLNGYRIVLDPGHGGLDPGAIVESQDGRGNKVYVVEDEYCYDIALRVYKDLKRYGAEVFLTVISPNQTIRQSPDASLTFVNEKNEVWNDSLMNKKNRSDCWPVGGQYGLNRRVELVQKFLESAPREKTLFISIHADNQPYAGEGTIILYHPDEEGKESHKLADFMTDYLGMGSCSHSQELRILNSNPAGASVLIETRNLAYPNNSWAIRNEDLRQNDADRIIRGIVSYVNGKR